MKHVYDVGNKIFELMTELFENFSDADNFILTLHGIEIVNEIADYAENTYEFGMAKKENKEIFKKLENQTAKNIWFFLLSLLSRTAHGPYYDCLSIIIVMPILREQMYKEMS